MNNGNESQVCHGKSRFQPTLFTCKLDFSLRKKLVQRNTWNIVLHGAETCKLREVDQKYLESFEMLCWRRMEKISRIDRVQNEKV